MTALALYRASRSQLVRVLGQSGLVGALLRGPVGTGAQTNPWPVPETLHNAALPAPPTPLPLRSFYVSAIAESQIQVAVPPLGESITDGAVAAILKSPGDAVEEDEPIVQIETDKVTIDVRAPRAGIIDAILVKEDENVEVGRIVATVTEGVQAARAEGPPPKEPAHPPPPAAEAAVAAAAASATPAEPTPAPAAPETAAAAGPAPRQPSIRFPPRRTATGDVISMMPAAEAAAAIAAATESLIKPQRMRAEPLPPHLFIRLPPRPSGPPPPPRKQLSEWEIEQIMLGGADCM